MVKRVGGFMELARQIVRQTPGLTAQEVYKRANEVAKQRDKKLSAAKSPQASLVATLHKHYGQHGLERKLIGREFHYSPADVGASQGGMGINAGSGGCCRTLSSELDNRIDALVKLGRFPDKQTAERELVTIGIEALIAKLAS